jgi:hypothetical protein
VLALQAGGPTAGSLADGIAATFAFASPGNKAATGPLSRFNQMITKCVLADRTTLTLAVSLVTSGPYHPHACRVACDERTGLAERWMHWPQFILITWRQRVRSGLVEATG